MVFGYSAKITYSYHLMKQIYIGNGKNNRLLHKCKFIFDANKGDKKVKYTVLSSAYWLRCMNTFESVEKISRRKLIVSGL